MQPVSDAPMRSHFHVVEIFILLVAACLQHLDNDYTHYA